MRQKQLTVLLFYADGQQVKETEQMEKQLKSLPADIELFKINTLVNPKMGESFHVGETPLMLLLHNGREIWRQAPPLSETSLLFYLGQQSSRQENKISEN
jgi:hypothetical protein